MQPLALGQRPVLRPIQALQLNEPARDQREGEPGTEQADPQPPSGAGPLDAAAARAAAPAHRRAA